MNPKIAKAYIGRLGRLAGQDSILESQISDTTIGLPRADLFSVSAQSFFDFSDFDAETQFYTFQLLYCIFSNDGVDLEIIMDTDGGASPDEGASAYQYQVSSRSAIAGTTNAESSAAPLIRWNAVSIGNASGEYAMGSCRLYPGLGSRKAAVLTDLVSMGTTTIMSNHRGTGTSNAEGIVNWIRIRPSAGTFTCTVLVQRNR